MKNNVSLTVPYGSSTPDAVPLKILYPVMGASEGGTDHVMFTKDRPLVTAAMGAAGGPKVLSWKMVDGSPKPAELCALIVK